MIGAVCTICVLAALTMPAGIGGGILFVPVLRLIAQMAQKQASALSQVLITGASIGSILFQILWQIRHKTEPLLVQPFYVVLMMPAVVSGSLVGVYLQHILPQIVSIIVLVVLCIISSITIFRKGFQTYRLENGAIAARRSATLSISPNLEQIPPPPLSAVDRASSLISIEAGINASPETGLYAIDECSPGPGQSFMYDDSIQVSPSSSMVSISALRRRERSRRMSFLVAREVDGDRSPGIDHTLEDKSIVKQSKFMRMVTKSVFSFVVFVVGYWATILAFTALRGSRAHPSVFEPCGTGYWILTAFQCAIGLALCLLVALKEWFLILQTFVTGIAATISGASGGIILNPILLHRGLDPQQTSATATIIMFVMASCSTLEFMLNGTIDPALASLMAVTFVGSIVGMTFVTWLIKRLGRQSILVFLLGALVVIGGGMMVYLGITDVIRTYDEGGNPFALGRAC